MHFKCKFSAHGRVLRLQPLLSKPASSSPYPLSSITYRPLPLGLVSSIPSPPLLFSRSFSRMPQMAPLKTPWKAQSYPSSRRSDHVDTYKSEKLGQVQVPDPYNWLEQNTPETDAWTTEQAEFTRKYLVQNPQLEDLERQLRANFDFEKVCKRRY